jgi:hypothetical protein
MSDNGNGRISSSCEKLRAELDGKMLEIAREDDAKTKCEKLEGIVSGTFGALIDLVARISRRIPGRPWIVNVIGGVSLLTIVGLAWAAGERLARMEARDTAICIEASSACEKAEKVAIQVSRTDRRMARIDGNLEALMLSRGLRPLPPVRDSGDTIP